MCLNIMLNLDYIHWEDYYQSVCLPYYKNLKANSADYNYSDELFNQFLQFFDSCFDLMKYYVWNNGEFYFNRYAIFRNFYRQGYIDDGDSWMILNHMIRQNIDKKEILEFALVKNFKIFDDFIETVKNIPETEKNYINQPQKDILKENIDNFSSYIRVICYDSYYNRFYELNEKYSNGLLTEEDYWDFLCAIEGVIAYYWRYIKKYYKYLHNISLNNPVQGYTKAGNDGFINDADCWLEYIEDWNAYLNINDEALKKQKIKEIIDYYRDKVINTYIKIHSDSDKKAEEKYNFIKNDDIKQHIALDESIVEYKAETLGISEYSYNILLDFFKNNTEIKNVWLYGSRARGENKKNSDLDMVTDCSYNYLKKIKNELKELPIPYYCDLHTLDDYENKIFLMSASKEGTKKIYCADNFNIFWDTQTNTNPVKINISSFIVNNQDYESKKICWQDLYKDWRKLYINISDEFKNIFDTDKFLSFYAKTVYILEVYLANNGIFVDGSKIIMQYSFKYQLFDDISGNSWMLVDKSVAQYEHDDLSITDLINIVKNNFYIFDNLNRKFEDLVNG